MFGNDHPAPLEYPESPRGGGPCVGLVRMDQGWGHNRALRKISKDNGAGEFAWEVTLVTFWIVTFGTLERRHDFANRHRASRRSQPVREFLRTFEGSGSGAAALVYVVIRVT